MAFLRNLIKIERTLKYILHSRLASIYVTPSTPSHVSEQVEIRGDGFTPDSPITVQSQLKCPSEFLDFESYAHISTGADGTFTLTNMESIGGTYTGVDGMGLLWSMVKKNSSLDRTHINNGKIKLEYNFNVYKNHINVFDESNIPSVLCNTAIQRFLVSDSVIRENVKVGRIRGTLYRPDGEGPFPVIIVLHGGNKKRKPIEQDAAILADQGYVALSLPFFGVDDLPKIYTEGPIDIEYFEEAIDWLRSLDCVIPSEIGILAQSKGAEVSLAIIEHLPQVKAVCWVNGNIASVLTSIKYKDKETPMLEGDFGKIEIDENGSMSIRNLYDHLKNRTDTFHKFEKSAASILFVVSLDDQSWHVLDYSNIAKQRMDGVGKTNYEIITYEGLGHCIDFPYAPVCTHSSHPLAPPGVRIFYGGTNTIQHSKQQLKFWNDVFQFFQSTLNKSE